MSIYSNIRSQIESWCKIESFTVEPELFEALRHEILTGKSPRFSTYFEVLRTNVLFVQTTYGLIKIIKMAESDNKLKLRRKVK